MLQVQGHLETVLTNTANGLVSDMVIHLDTFREESGARQTAPPAEEKKTA